MNTVVCEIVTSVARNRFGNRTHLRGSNPVSGGCISKAMLVDFQTDDGGEVSLFVKTNTLSFRDAFETEADGLRALREVEAIRVPEPIAVESAEDSSIMIVEAIPTLNAPVPAGFFGRFGHQLAELHRASMGKATASGFGYHRDNVLGAARQPNAWHHDWVEFFASERLGFQFNWAREQGLASSQLFDLISRLIDALPDLLSLASEEACLLHGDLWSGNYLCDDRGQPVIIDPAVYFGHREAEFGMIELFGGCPVDFYSAYREVLPWHEGYQRRFLIYKLYHLLNHLNLFGSSYESGCVACARSALG